MNALHNPFPELYPLHYRYYRNLQTRLSRPVLPWVILYCINVSVLVILIKLVFPAPTPEWVMLSAVLFIGCTAMILLSLVADRWIARTNTLLLQAGYESFTPNQIKEIAICLRDISSWYPFIDFSKGHPRQIALQLIVKPDPVVFFRATEFLFSNRHTFSVFPQVSSKTRFQETPHHTLAGHAVLHQLHRPETAIEPC